MSIVLDGTTGVTAPALTGPIDAANLTGVLPAIDGSALTGIDTTPPTTYSSVGTYIVAYLYLDLSALPTYTIARVDAGGAYSGSTLRINTLSAGNTPFLKSSYTAEPTATLAGTWRLLGGGAYGGKNASYDIYYQPMLFVRIS